MLTLADGLCEGHLVLVKAVKLITKIELRIIIKKYEVDTAIQFPTKSILPPMVFTKTNRQRGSWIRKYLR